MGPNLELVVSVWSGRRRYEYIGLLPVTDRRGHMTRDNETYIEILISEIETRNKVMKAILKNKARQRRKKKKTPMLPLLTVTC
jgi:hypothetical protein